MKTVKAISAGSSILSNISIAEANLERLTLHVVLKSGAVSAVNYSIYYFLIS